MNIDELEILNPAKEDIKVVDYPVAGTSETIGCSTVLPIKYTKTAALNASSSSSWMNQASYLRVNSFSSCKLPNNTALVAISSQDVGIDTLPKTSDQEELAYRLAHRVHIVSTSLGNYASSVRCATITDVNQQATSDCKQGTIDIKIDVDSSIWADGKLTSIWALGGPAQGVKFKIVGRISPDIWRIIPATDDRVDSIIGSSFHFIPYGAVNSTYPNSLNSISPLPYIEVDGSPVSAVNPQIATNSFLPPSELPRIFVIAEAPVNGAYQLFFYSFRLTANFELFGWRQLTFDGENRNAKMKVDSKGNLHVTWESNRCAVGQVFYGMIGPSSRELANQTFVSAVDKQANSEGDAIIEVTSPQSVPTSAWSNVGLNGGTASGSGTTVSAVGNPKTQKFASFTTLNSDEESEAFDGMFSQLSYQINCDLNMSIGSDFFDEDDIANEFKLFKEDFAPTRAGNSTNVNVYTNGGNKYTIDEPQIVYEGNIPFLGSYKNVADEQIALKHFMLVAVPEKVRFVAKSTQGMADIQEEHFTGKFKLGVVFETSANYSEQLSYAKSHWVRLFGSPISFGQANNYKVAVHYSHVRNDSIDPNIYSAQYDEDLRFVGDMIVVVNGKAVLGESFIADFSDAYRQFDIGFGCPVVNEFRTLSKLPYDGSVNANISGAQLNFTNIVIGPHSAIANDFICGFSKTDRNVSRMVVKSDADEYGSLSAATEAWDTDTQYALSLGLNREKFGLNQIPITFDGTNSSPSIALDRCGNPHIAYQSNRDGEWEIYYTGMIDKGLPFRFDTRITDEESQSLSPSIAIDNGNRRIISWHDDRTGVYQIYAARSVSNYGCVDRCEDRIALPDDPYWGGFEYVSEYDPYIEDPYYASLGQLSFSYKNEDGLAKTVHFRANFYSDSTFTSFYKDIDSRMDISNWRVKDKQIGYSGVTVASGEQITVTYDPSKEDEIFDALYYVEIEIDDGATINPLETTLIYFSPVVQTPKSVIPAVYTNSTNATVSGIHFRLTVYRDQAMTDAVLSASTDTDVAKWISGSGAFPSGGISVAAHQMASVIYNPEFVSLSDSENRNVSNITQLLCGVTYWVKIESKIGSTYNVIDSYATRSSCDEINRQYRYDADSSRWICSGQGFQDVRITLTDSHALFPQIDSSEDGIAYIAWEDRRFAKDQDTNAHYIYYCVWDGKNDVFYSSAQGFKDREVSTYSYYKPTVIVNNMQHVTFLFSDGVSIYTKICSLYRAKDTVTSSSSSSVLGDQGVFNEYVLALSDDEVSGCINLQVYEEDVVDYYHKDGQNRIALVNDCKVRFEVKGPSGTYAVRFKNESGEWSDWLNVLPSLPNYPSSSSSGALLDERSEFNGYFIGDDSFVIPWVISRGNGNKTVNCQILTYSGVTPTFSTEVVARYEELEHKIEFFKDSALTVKASLYNGTPVVSMNVLNVDQNDVTTLLATEASSPTIYVKVTFKDPNRLNKILRLGNLRKYGLGNSLTFNVNTQGKSQSSLILTNTSIGVYTGSFAISSHDGIENKDGLAVVTVNVPSVCSLPTSSSSANCLNTFLTPADIKLNIQNQLDDSKIDLEKFRLKYESDVICTFPSNSCVDGTEVFTEADSDTAIDMPPPFSGSVGCKSLMWISPPKGEKFFYLPNGGQNATDWTITSRIFEFDFSDSRIDYLKFSSDTSLDDILLMVRADETVVSSDVASGATYNVGFSVPQGSIVFAATDGFYCHKAADCNNGSAAKTFKVADIVIATVPAGTVSNHGTGNIALFNVPNALGYTEVGSSSSAAAGITNVLKTTFAKGVSKNELNNRGFITGNNILRFKFVHVISGAGFANIEGITCGATCFDLLGSSSSSS